MMSACKETTHKMASAAQATNRKSRDGGAILVLYFKKFIYPHTHFAVIWHQPMKTGAAVLLLATCMPVAAKCGRG
jgi:hypothetical protein